MAGYTEYIRSYDEQREQQIANLGENLSLDLGTREGRIQLRRSLDVADDRYVIEVSPPIGATPQPIQYITARLYCKVLQDLVVEHVGRCESGCTCDHGPPWPKFYTSADVDSDVNRADDNTHQLKHSTFEHDDDVDWHRSTPRRERTCPSPPTQLSYGRPDAAMLLVL